jgi:hypothetical protein
VEEKKERKGGKKTKRNETKQNKTEMALTKDELSEKTCAQLRKMLKAAGLDTKGKKSIIVQRLIDAQEPNEDGADSSNEKPAMAVPLLTGNRLLPLVVNLAQYSLGVSTWNSIYLEGGLAAFMAATSFAALPVFKED